MTFSPAFKICSRKDGRLMQSIRTPVLLCQQKILTEEHKGGGLRGVEGVQGVRGVPKAESGARIRALLLALLVLLELLVLLCLCVLLLNFRHSPRVFWRKCFAFDRGVSSLEGS